MAVLDYLSQKLKMWEGSHEFENLPLYSLNYVSVENSVIKEFFEIFHSLLFWHFENINGANGHYWADPSRQLIHIIDEFDKLRASLRNTEFDFEIDAYYENIINKCREFLVPSGGSGIPEELSKINIIETIPIFTMKDTVEVENRDTSFQLKVVGNGSYATVFKYKDTYYDKYFAIKKGSKNLNDKEKERFKQEFDEMKELASPYILEVYRFDDSKFQYIMEYADYTLDKYISKNNTKLRFEERVNLIRQVLRGFDYIHSKGRLHRDISTTNVLLKNYDGMKVVKISDFGLVKVPNSNLTSMDTEFKGSLNDPKLNVFGGFKNFSIEHETFALIRLIYFIIMGSKTIRINGKDKEFDEFISKGVSDNLNERYKSVAELKTAFENYVKSELKHQ